MIKKESAFCQKLADNICEVYVNMLKKMRAEKCCTLHFNQQGML